MVDFLCEDAIAIMDMESLAVPAEERIGLDIHQSVTRREYATQNHHKRRVESLGLCAFTLRS
jgi:hypothetical protein